MKNYEFYIPPLREWPRRWLAGYRLLWRGVRPYTAGMMTTVGLRHEPELTGRR